MSSSGACPTGIAPAQPINSSAAADAALFWLCARHELPHGWRFSAPVSAADMQGSSVAWRLAVDGDWDWAVCGTAGLYEGAASCQL